VIRTKGSHYESRLTDVQSELSVTAEGDIYNAEQKLNITA